MATPDRALSLDEARDRLIVALDVADADAALSLAKRLRGRCGWVKVGLELFCATGPGLVGSMRELGFEVFLDLKLHDIPNTVAGAVRSISGLGASLLTVHAAGGAAMLDAAREAAAGLTHGPRLLAVTVLTSMGGDDLAGVGVQSPVAAQVLKLARLAKASGLSGMVCSPLEAQMLRLELGAGPELIIPGIRPTDGERGDQTRTATPGEAMLSGASRLVVGRPITRAQDPAAAADAIAREMAEAMTSGAPLFE